MLENTQFWDELAIQSYKAILKKNPGESKIHKNLGLAYGRTGRLNKAARSFERAVKYDKDFAEAYYHLGTTYQKLGKKAEAIRSFNKYQKLMHGGKSKAPVVASLLEEMKSESQTS